MQSVWHELIAEMRVWKREHEVAVHKPLLLLMILARAQEGGANFFCFRDLVEPLEKALRFCGPDAKALHPEYPFWHLQTDGFWQIDDAEQFEPAKASQSPTKKSLLEGEAVARVHDHLWHQLVASPELPGRLAAAILERFWPDRNLHGQVIVSTGVHLAS